MLHILDAIWRKQMAQKICILPKMTKVKADFAELPQVLDIIDRYHFHCDPEGQITLLVL